MEVELGKMYLWDIAGWEVVVTEIIRRYKGEDVVRIEWSVGHIVNATFVPPRQLSPVKGGNES